MYIVSISTRPECSLPLTLDSFAIAVLNVTYYCSPIYLSITETIDGILNRQL